VVSSVTDNSPARKAGLQTGDVLVSVGDLQIESPADWEEVESYARAGRALGVTIQRGKKDLSVVVVPEEIPLETAPHRTDKFGLRLAEITPEVANYMRVRNRDGIVVLGAEESSWATGWQLQEGDIIRQVGKKVVRSLDDYFGIMSNLGHGYRVVFTIERASEIFFVQVIT
jgi:serine protease Do